MFSFIAQYCNDCNDMKHAVELIETKMAKLIRNKWQNRRYLTEKHFSDREFKDLIYYKEIAQGFMYDKKYITDVSYKDIISKIKIITK